MSEESSSIPFEKREGENPERFIPDGMNAFERNVKRIGDCLLAFIALIVFSPLFLICYIVVRCEDGGPAVFKQEKGMDKEKIRRPLWKIQKKNNMQSRMYGLKMI